MAAEASFEASKEAAAQRVEAGRAQATAMAKATLWTKGNAAARSQETIARRHAHDANRASLKVFCTALSFTNLKGKINALTSNRREAAQRAARELERAAAATKSPARAEMSARRQEAVQGAARLARGGASTLAVQNMAEREATRAAKLAAAAVAGTEKRAAKEAEAEAKIAALSETYVRAVARQRASAEEAVVTALEEEEQRVERTTRRAQFKAEVWTSALGFGRSVVSEREVIESLRKSGVKRVNGRTKRQCDRTLLPVRSSCHRRDTGADLWSHRPLPRWRRLGKRRRSRRRQRRPRPTPPHRPGNGNEKRPRRRRPRRRSMWLGSRRRCQSLAPAARTPGGFESSIQHHPPRCTPAPLAMTHLTP